VPLRPPGVLPAICVELGRPASMLLVENLLARHGVLGYIPYTMVSSNFANAFSFSYWYWGFFASIR
jgi:hypothetical protein